MHRILPALLLFLLFVPAASAGPVEEAVQTSCVYQLNPGSQADPVHVTSGPGQVGVAVAVAGVSFGVGVDLTSCI